MATASRNYYHDPDDYDIGPLEEEILLRIGSDEDDSDISISESLEDQLLSFTEEEMSYRKSKGRVNIENLINDGITLKGGFIHDDRDGNSNVDGHNDQNVNFDLCKTGKIADVNNNQINDRCVEEIADMHVQKEMLQSTNSADKESNMNNQAGICVKRIKHNQESSLSRREMLTSKNEKRLLGEGVDNDNKVKHDNSDTSARIDQYQIDNTNFELDAEEKKMVQLREEVDNILADIDDILNSNCRKEKEINTIGINKSGAVLENATVEESESSVSVNSSEISSQESIQSLEAIITGNKITVVDSSSESRSDTSEVDLQESINPYSTSSTEMIHEEVDRLDCHREDDELIIDDVYDIWQAFYSETEESDTTCRQIESICGVGKYQSENDFDNIESANSQKSYKYDVNECLYKSNKTSIVATDPKPRFIFINPAKMQTFVEDVYDVKRPEYEIEFV